MVSWHEFWRFYLEKMVLIKFVVVVIKRGMKNIKIRLKNIEQESFFEDVNQKKQQIISNTRTKGYFLDDKGRLDEEPKDIQVKKF